jgi:hypothetical protein
MSAAINDRNSMGIKTKLKWRPLNRESANQLLETLEEWNDYLERYPPLVLQERPP